MKGKFEILSPGGSLEGIKATINAGADAVYTGGKLFGAREYANNLDVSQMKEALEYAHLREKKIYLTVNTLLKDSEIEEQLYEYILPFYNMGLDAVIVQDYGVMKFIHDNFEKLPIHASTQMCIMGSDTSNWLKKYGVSRIVTPRELSLEEIKNIYDNTGLEIESFVHGALCYSYSGICMLSSFIGGRSGNRGKCAQPCRLEYDVLKDDKLLNPGNSKYVLSPKDICTLDLLKELDEAGVYSLKIEGRMKKPEYAAGVTELYRKYTDIYYETGEYKVKDSDYKDALSLFNRNGFSRSYFQIHNSKDMISLKKPEFRAENTVLTERINEQYIKKDSKVAIKIHCIIKKDNQIKLISKYKEYEAVSYGQVPDEAKSRPIDKETVTSKLSKVGETDFEIESIEVEVDDNLFVTVGALNELRRQNLEELKNIILKKSYRDVLPTESSEHNSDNERLGKALSENKSEAFGDIMEQVDSKKSISVLVSDKRQFDAVPRHELIKRIYLESETFSENTESVINNKGELEIYLAMPRIFRLKDKEIFMSKYPDLSIFDGFLIRNIEEYFFIKGILPDCKNIIFDYMVYSFNKISKSILNEMGTTTIPLELNGQEIKRRGCDGEMICYGYMPVMTTANCLNKTCAACNKNNDVLVLKDRKNYKSNVRTVCDYCYNVIYNSKPLSLLKYMDRLSEMNINRFRLDFSLEKAGQVKEITEKFIKTVNGELTESLEDIADSTRGHFKRGVM